MGPRDRGRRHRARRRVRRHRSGRSLARRAGAFPRCSTAGASRFWSRWRSRRICMWSEATRDPLQSRLRQASRVRELVPEFRRLRQAGQARPRVMPAVRLGQGREGHHGAAPRAQGQEHADHGAGRGGRARAGRSARAGRDDLAAGEGVSREAERAARSPDVECRQCRQEISRGSAQDALRRDRASLDLRRGDAAGRQGAARGRHRVSPAARAAGGDGISHGIFRSPHGAKRNAGSVEDVYRHPRDLRFAPSGLQNHHPAAASFSRACQNRSTRCAE